MTRQEFAALASSKIIMLDGATGTELARRGMPGGVCPELWVLEHPEAIIDVQQSYFKAGSDIVYAPTFGANRVKLGEFGAGERVFEINRDLARFSRQAASGKFVFGDIAPTGQFIEPNGDLPFDEAVAIYREQARGLIAGGVDGFAIETMMDIQEARAALIAIREISDLPVIVTLTFDESGRTLTGCSAASALITLQSLGADAFGCNCSTGPEAMLELIASIRPLARIPLVAKPNAGMPKLVNMRTVFDLAPEGFAAGAARIAAAGAAIVGGCCGTTPDHIRALAAAVAHLKPQPAGTPPGAVASAREYRILAPDQPFAVIGERINPTGKKKLQAALLAGDFDLISEFALDQTEQGAALLDVNCGMSGIDEAATLRRLVAEIGHSSMLPLCIDTTNPAAAEAALRLYPGRALFNSISAEKDRLEKILPIAARYAAMLIALPLTDAGIPETLEGRIAALETIFAAAARYGIDRRDCCVDALVMTVSASPEAAGLTLDTIEYASKTLGMNTVCGLSNVSFGLPRRELVNSAFLGMALGRGLNMAIANPAAPMIMDMAAASDVLARRDRKMANYLAKYADSSAANAASAADTASPEEKVSRAVIRGEDETIERLLEDALAAGVPAQKLVDDSLIPAIGQVGDFFEKKTFFLPQLVRSADTMRRAMTFLLPRLAADSAGVAERPKIILATVKGDIHDIGKNIVGLMLRNYGFEVIDLGKDVPAEAILDAAVQSGARLVGLSALMTTTMVEMDRVVKLAKTRGMNHLHFIVGGAVLNEDYAAGIGAIYAADALETVKIAKKLN